MRCDISGLSHVITEKNKKIDELNHCEITQKEVIGLIDSLCAVLCPKSVDFQCNSYSLHQMAENGQQLPERPKDQLYEALNEVKTRLMNGGLTNVRLI